MSLFLRLVLIISLLFAAEIVVFAQPTTYDSLLTIVRIKEQKKPDTVLVTVLNQLAYRYDGFKTDSALLLAEKARMIAEQIDFKRGLARSFINIGNINETKGKYTLALQAHKQGIIIAEGIADTSLIARGCNGLGIVYWDKGEYQSALETYQRSLELYERIGDTINTARAVNNIAILYQQMNNYVEAMRFYRKSLAIALSSHDKRSILVAQGNIGQLFFINKQYDSALIYTNQSLSIAEEIHDKHSIAARMNDKGEILSAMQRYDEALSLLFQSLHLKEEIGESTYIINSLISIATVYSASNRARQALPFAFRAVDSAKKYNAKAYMKGALNVLATVFDSLGRHKEALAVQKELMVLKDSLLSEESLQKMLSLREEYESAKKDAQIHVLQEEQKVQTVIRFSLLGALSTAIIGSLVLGWLFMKKQQSEKYILLQKKQLEVQAQEIQIINTQLQEQNISLQDLYHDVAAISTIGKEITRSLDLETILNKVYEFVNQVMDASIFGIGIYKPDEKAIEFTLAIERGQRYKPYKRSMENKNQFAVWCIEHMQTVIINNLEEEYSKFLEANPYIVDKALQESVMVDDSSSNNPISLLYLPLAVEQRVLGIITVQSFQLNAYTSHEIELLNALASYISIALDNAFSYNNLNEALFLLQKSQTQLAQAEKMASLGTLVAGVAHELNTPIGVAVTAASTLQSRTSAFVQRFTEGGLKKSELEAFVETAQTGADLTLRNLERAANLIQSFKQVAVDQTSDTKRRFKLRHYIEGVITSLEPKWKTTLHRVEIECDETLEMETYPGAIAQIITNLIDNSLLHGFQGYTQEGIMRIVVEHQAPSNQAPSNQVTITYSDNGRGIPSEVLPRIFDPFFTTKQAQGGTGLGMHIVYNLVTQKLGGEITVSQAHSGGVSFEIELPIPLGLSQNHTFEARG